MQTFPVHVVIAWLGHDALIAQKHYLQVTDTDFDRAAQSGAVALHFPVQHGDSPDRTGSQEPPEVLAGCGDMRGVANACENVPNGEVVPP